MNKILLQIVALATIALCSCNKHTADVLSTPQTARTADTALVRIKRVDVTNLPSPYYQFAYDDSGYVTSINFASGFYQYELKYENKRLKKMTNIVNGGALRYTYHNGNVSDVDEYSGPTGERYGHYDLTYNAARKLTTLEYSRFDNASKDSIAERRFEFHYRPDGNLSSYKSFWRNNAGELAWVSTTSFDHYDNGRNVDDFAIYKPFFDHFLFLPAVKFHQNNPGTSRIIGVNNDYEISYAFSYDDQLPKSKTTTMRQTRGSSAGHVITGNTSYSY